MRAQSTLVVMITLALAPLTSRAEEAENTGVAGSGISQGSGAITHRSDVEVTVESLKGTSRARLGAVGNAVGTKLSAIRKCYVTVTEQRPTKEGEIRVEVQIVKLNGPVKLNLARDDVGDRELTKCVVGAIKSASYRGIKAPAGGTVVMSFANTAARGAKLVAEERSGAGSAKVTNNAAGLPEVAATTSGGEVEVRITGRGETPAKAVAALHRAVQSRIGTLLDCRRRASRRGMSPAGTVSVSLRVTKSGAASGRSRTSTVEDKMTPKRVVKALRAAARGEKTAAGSYHIAVTFADR